jgi:hypothetical protein
MMAKVPNLDLVECSNDAKAIAEQFVSEEKGEREVAEKKSLEYLRLGDFRSASLAVSDFEAKQASPRGLGIDWTKPNTEGNVQLLEAIFESRPKILAGLPETDWQPLRIGAAMMHLWGTNKASKWLPVDFVGISKFDHDTAARMILFSVQHLSSIESWSKMASEIRKVEILGSEDSCPACKKLAGKRFSIDNIPELPYERCTHEMGCRCEVLPVI